MDEKDDEKLSTEGEKVYTKIKGKLKDKIGKIVAIEVDSGEYFVGNDTMDAYKQAAKKHPDKLFYFKRVGAKATYFIGAIA